MRTEAAVGQTRWTPDGTQAPAPPPVFADPLAGLVTGVKAGHDVTGDVYDDFTVEVVKPVVVNDEEARAKMAAVLAGEDDDEPPSGRPVALPPPTGSSLASIMPGMVPEPDRKPARLRVRQALGGYPKGAANRGKQLGDKRQELMAARFGSRHSQDTEASMAQDRKPASTTNIGGIVLGLVLLAVFGFIALQVIISIVESIGSLLD